MLLGVYPAEMVCQMSKKLTVPQNQMSKASSSEVSASVPQDCVSLLELHARYHRLGGSNIRYIFADSSGGQKSEIQVLTVWVSPETPLLGLQMANFWLCPHMTFPLCMHSPDVSFSYKDTSPIRLRSQCYDLI